jgi:hypothetical protein
MQVRTRAMAKTKPASPPPTLSAPSLLQSCASLALSTLKEHFSDASALETPGLAALRRISAILCPPPLAASMSAPSNSAKLAAFQELVDLLVDGSRISAFELQASSAVPSMITFVSAADVQDEVVRLERLHAVSQALQTQRHGKDVLSIIVHKLVSVLETMDEHEMSIKPPASFSVDSFSRGRVANFGAMPIYHQALFALSQPLKLMLKAVEGSELTGCMSSAVLVEPLAKLSAVEDFLHNRWQATRRAAAAAARRTTAESAACGGGRSSGAGTSDNAFKSGLAPPVKGEADAAVRPIPMPLPRLERRMTRSQARAMAEVEAETAVTAAAGAPPPPTVASAAATQEAQLQARRDALMLAYEADAAARRASRVSDRDADHEMDLATDGFRGSLFTDRAVGFADSSAEDMEDGLGDSDQQNELEEDDDDKDLEEDEDDDMTDDDEDGHRMRHSDEVLPMVEDLQLDDPVAGGGMSQGSDGAAMPAADTTAAPVPAAGNSGDVRTGGGSLRVNRMSLFADVAAAPPPRRVVLLANGNVLPRSMHVLQAVVAANPDALNSNSGSLWGAQHRLHFALATEVPEASEAAAVPDAVPSTSTAHSPPTCQREQHLVRAIEVAASPPSADAGQVPRNSCLILLRLLEAYAAERHYFAASSRAMPHQPAAPALPPSSNETFFSTRTNARLLQQLGDVVAVCGHALPAWLSYVPSDFKCLLPFESRRRCSIFCICLDSWSSPAWFEVNNLRDEDHVALFAR